MNMPTPAWTTSNTRELLRRGSMDKPHESFSMPTAQNISTQINQLRVNVQPSPISTRRVPRVGNNVPSVPKPISGIRVTRNAIPGTDNVRVNINFNRDPADTAYQSANVYLTQGAGNPNLVGVTTDTQTSFTVPKTGAASVVTVQSVGAGNALPLGNSPSRSITLK